MNLIVLDKEKTEKYMVIIREIANFSKIIDIHVHPFEVMFGDIKYIPNSQFDGLYSSNNSLYLPPETGSITEQACSASCRKLDSHLRGKFSLLTFRKLYTHTGPKHFADHMRLSGIDKVFLLPVMNEKENGEAQMDLLYNMFGDDDRFSFGYCIPNNIPNDDIVRAVKNAVERFKVKAIKIHPNITGIDLTSRYGIERVERMLEASRETKLKVIVHGGRSPDIRNEDAIEYSTLKNLQNVDWGITDEHVVIAHAGTYGHDASEIRDDVLPLMNKLLSLYVNLLVDVSGLHFDSLYLVVKSIDFERILFGSDALYSFQWESLVKLLFALEKSTSNFEECFLKISSVNPVKYIFS